jgi:hypothetical protein
MEGAMELGNREGIRKPRQDGAASFAVTSTKLLTTHRAKVEVPSLASVQLILSSLFFLVAA